MILTSFYLEYIYYLIFFYSIYTYDLYATLYHTIALNSYMLHFEQSHYNDEGTLSQYHLHESTYQFSIQITFKWSPNNKLQLLEHSICQPGLPLPHGEFQL